MEYESMNIEWIKHFSRKFDIYSLGLVVADLLNIASPGSLASISGPELLAVRKWVAGVTNWNAFERYDPDRAFTEWLKIWPQAAVSQHEAVIASGLRAADVPEEAIPVPGGAVGGAAGVLDSPAIPEGACARCKYGLAEFWSDLSEFIFPSSYPVSAGGRKGLPRKRRTSKSPLARRRRTVARRRSASRRR